MEKLTLYVSSSHGSFGLDINNDSQIAFERYMELVSIFWIINENTNSIEIPILSMNDEIRKKYNQFIDKYKTELPALYKLKSALDKIEDDEFFFTSNTSQYNTDQILFIGNLLTAYNSHTDDKERAKVFEEVTKKQNDIFSDLLEKYDVKVFDSTQRINIGEPKREKRVCRFCNNSMNTEPKVYFRKKAHAFSEALGNKSVVLNEECDTCNETFGSTIEKDFIGYLDIFRVFFKVKGKSGIPKLKYANGAMIHNSLDEDSSEKNITVISSQDISHDQENDTLSTSLQTTHKIKEVNIYKTLCKYALSVIDDNELVNLKHTIDWLMSNDDKKKQLPKVATLISNNLYVDTPVLGLYIRKDNDYTIPHIVGEFKFKSLIFVYILPFSDKDKNDFLDKESFKNFWNAFKHYSSIPSWKYHDFSCTKSKKVQYKINMVQQEEKS